MPKHPSTGPTRSIKKRAAPRATRDPRREESDHQRRGSTGLFSDTNSSVSLKEKIDIIQSIVTIIAIIIGGIWTYTIFIKDREEYPHANISQKITHVAFSDKINVLRAGVELSNAGTTLLTTGESVVRVQQIVPISCPDRGVCYKDEVSKAIDEVDRTDDRFPWLLIAERVNKYTNPISIEPGEKQEFDFEFAVPTDVSVVRVYTYFRNDVRSNRELEYGWPESSYYDFRINAKDLAK